MTKNSSYLFLFLVILISISNQAHSLKPESCYVSWNLDNEALELELSNYAGCIIKITTTEDRILSFRYIEGHISDLSDSIQIYDGLDAKGALISLVNGMPDEVKKLNFNYNKTVYTTGTSATLHVRNEISSGNHLKIQKAVNCPFNLGTYSQCGRIFDDVSCYCATFVKRVWGDQVIYCSDNSMQLVSLESAEEERAIYAAWGRDLPFWTSLNDAGDERLWIWSSTGKTLSPGYSNWEPAEPTGESCVLGYKENCMVLNFDHSGGWYDHGCMNAFEAICENNP